MRVPDVGNMVLMVSATLLALLALCCDQTSAQPIVTPKYQATIQTTIRSSTSPRTTFPTRMSTTGWMPTTKFRAAVVHVSTPTYKAAPTTLLTTTESMSTITLIAISGSSIPRCSWSMWLVVTGASLYTLRHLILQ